MRAILLLCAFIPLQSMGQANFVATSPAKIRKQTRNTAVIQIPHLISYQKFMSLPVQKRQVYLNRIAKAMAEFETSTNRKLNRGQRAEIETFHSQIAMYLSLMPTASAQSNTTQDDGTSLPEGTKIIRVTPNSWKYLFPGNYTSDIYYGKAPSLTIDHTLDPQPIPVAPRQAVYTEPDANGVAHGYYPKNPTSIIDNPDPLNPKLTPGATTLQPSPPKAAAIAPPTNSDTEPVQAAPAPAAPAVSAAPPPDLSTPVSNMPKSAAPSTDAPATADTAPAATTPPPAAGRSGIDDTAKKCSFSKADLSTARAKYQAAKQQQNDCRIGDMDSTYKDAGFPEGGCKPLQSWPPPELIKDGQKAENVCKKQMKGGDASGMTLCNPALFCNADGDPFCQQIGQDVSMRCWNESANKDKTNTSKMGTTCKEGKLTKSQWDDMDKRNQKFCGTDGASELFCFECTKLKYEIEQANNEAGGDAPTTIAPAAQNPVAPTETPAVNESDPGNGPG